MIHEEKTTELDLSQPKAASPAPSTTPRWTEQTGVNPKPITRAHSKETELSWALRLVAAIAILALSIWLL